MNQLVSTFRLRRVLTNDVQRYWKPLLYGTLAAWGLTVLFYVGNIHPDVRRDNSMAEAVFAFLLLTAGLVLTSLSFRDMHHPLERYRYLMLPISNFERFASRYLLTGPVFALGLLVTFTVMDWSGNLAAEYWNGARDPLFDQFSRHTWQTIEGYLLLHSIAFIGAIGFRSFALIQTVLTVLLVGVSTLVVGYIALRIFYFDAYSFAHFHSVKPLDVRLMPAFTGIWMNYAVVVLLALWILYVAYRCLRAHEVQE